MIYNFFMNYRKIFSKNLIRLRKLKGLSQRDLAKKIGTSQRMVNYYENEPHTINIDKLKLLAETLHANISDFFNENKEQQFLDDLDVRWVKKIKELKKLSEPDRKEINKHINSLLEKSNLKKEKELQKTEK
jgi:transcriptional regulator with XRE-family HTH domain